MTVVGESALPHDAGRRDALHHRERVRKKITEHLKQHIGEEDIIASGPEKKIRVPVKGTKRWQFIHDRFIQGVLDTSAPNQIPARITVGTLIEVATGRREPDDVALVLASKDRRRGAWTSSNRQSKRALAARPCASCSVEMPPASSGRASAY